MKIDYFLSLTFDSQRVRESESIMFVFLAPTGALGEAMSVGRSPPPER